MIVFQHVFVSFLSRNTTYKLLKSICIHLEVNNIFFEYLTDLIEPNGLVVCMCEIERGDYFESRKKN